MTGEPSSDELYAQAAIAEEQGQYSEAAKLYEQAEDQLRHDYDEAQAEIARHHELITWLATELRWSVDVIKRLPVLRRVPYNAHLEKITRKLNREVG